MMMMELVTTFKSVLPRIKTRTRVGARPGTIVAHEDAPPPTIRVIRYGPEKLDDQAGVDVDKLPELVGTHAVTWIDVCGLGDATVIQKIGDLFNLHRLALEDVVNLHQRAKVEEYDDNVFVVARMPPVVSVPNTTQREDRTQRLDTEQLCMFLGKGYVVTFQERAGDCFEVVRERLKVHGRPIRKSKADYLAYALLDAVVDAYFPVMDVCGQMLDDLDDDVAESTSPMVMGRIHDAKANIRLLRRVIWPHREMLNQLMEGHAELIAESTRIYLRDVYDHTIQVIDILESYRETCSDLRDFYMSAVSNRMNEVMKVLTIIATIFIPLGFIAGVYGMNFDHDASPYNMPELHWFFGYPFALGIMFAISIGMLCFFRWKGWIGRHDQPSRRQ